MTYPGQQPPPYQPQYGPPPGQQPPAYQPQYGPPPGQQPTPQYGQPHGQQPPMAPPGQPPAPQPYGGMNGPVKGKDLLRACWSMLKTDKSLLMLPVLSAVFSFIALAIFFVPGLVIGLTSGTDNGARFGIYAGLVIGGFAASFVSIFFQAALVIGANQRADGGDPTVGSTLAGAWERKGAIFGWALLATVVGALIRAVEQRFGAVGRIIGILGGLAWAIATFLAVPVVVAEGVGPVDAVKRSSAIIKQTWGLGLRSTLRWGFIQFLLVLPAVAVLFIGIVLVGQGTAGAAIGVVLLVVGILALVGLGIVFGAVSQYARAMLYRYATGRPVPGLNPAMLAGAFAPKRGRRFA